MTTVYLALGSNVGKPERQVKQAVKLLSQFLKNVKQAPLYRSRAVGYTNQADFINTAISGQTDLSAEDLLAVVQEVERQVGRTPSFHWGPREIDIDIILYGDKVIKNPELTLPHPYFRQRDFVLLPLIDLSPNLQDPVTQKTVEELLSVLKKSQLSVIERVD